jgi:phosphoribosylformylglycinamidine synthase
MIGAGRVPVLDLDLEKRVQETCLKAADEGLLRSAHDCSDGGLAIAVAESCFSSLRRTSMGARLAFDDETITTAAQLFGESPSRIVVSFAESAGDRVREIAERLNCPFTPLGRVGGDRLIVKVNGAAGLDVRVTELENVWRASLARRMGTEVVAAAAE